MCYWFILIGAAAFLMHGPLINFRQKLNAHRWMYTFFFLFIYTSADRVNHMMRYVRRILCTHTKYSTKSIDSVMPIDLFCYSHLFTVTLNTTCHVKFIYWWKTLNAGHHLANVFQHVVRMNGFSRMFLFFFNFCTAQNNERNVWGAKVKWFYVWVFYIIQTYISTTFPNKSTW